MNRNSVLIATFVSVFGVIGGLYWQISQDQEAIQAPKANGSEVKAVVDNIHLVSASLIDPVERSPIASEDTLAPRQEWEAAIRCEILKEGSNHDEVCRLLGEWLEAAPDDAIGYVLSSFRDTDYIWINGAISEYFQKEEGYPEKMNSLARLEHDPRIMKGLLGTALVAWAHNDYLAAFDWISRSRYSPDLTSAVKALGDFMGESGKALEMLKQVNLMSLAPEMKAAYLKGLIRNWSSHDLITAAEWLNENHEITEIDGVIPELVGNAIAENAEFAMIWAESIRDDRLRMATILDTAETWCKTDRDSYTRWRQGLGARNLAWADRPPSD